MGLQIIMQNNFRFCVFNSISSTIDVWDCTPEEVIEFMVDRERARITEDVQRKVEQLRRGERPYFQFTMTFAEAVEQLRAHHGDKAMAEVLDSMEAPEPPAVPA